MGKFKTIFKKFLGFEDEQQEMDENINLEEELNKQKTYYGANEVKEEPTIDRKVQKLEPIYDEVEPAPVKRKEIVMYPNSFSQACDVVEKIVLGYVVVVDMEDVEIDTCKRIADFVLGAVYVLDGDVEKVSKKVFKFWIEH